MTDCVALQIPLGMSKDSEKRLVRAVKLIETILSEKVASQQYGRTTVEFIFDGGQIALATVEERIQIK